MTETDKNIKKNNVEKKEKKPITKVSLKDGKRLIESIYYKKENKTKYIFWENGEIMKTNNYKKNNVLYIPPNFHSKVLESRTLILPTNFQTNECNGNLDDLAENIENFIYKYVDISPQDRKIATHYIIMTWIYDKFHEVPYLRVMADYGSGKTRFLRVIGELCYKSIFASGGTTLSPIFRMIDDVKGTLIFDEADFSRSDKTSDLVKILNAGYSKGGTVMRSEGKGVFEVKYFNVFGPKILANREPFIDQALESRFLVIRMMRTKRKDLPSQLTNQFYKEAENIRNKLLCWRFQNYPISIDFDKFEIENVQPRLKQIALPILSTMKDEKVAKEFIRFIQNYNQELLDVRSDGIEADVIKAILYLKLENVNYPTTKKINEKLISISDLDDEYISNRKLGSIIKNKLHLKTTRKSNGFSLDLIKYDKDIKSLAERYGVDIDQINKEMNEMYVVNVKPEDINPFNN